MVKSIDDIVLEIEQAIDLSVKLNEEIDIYGKKKFNITIVITPKTPGPEIRYTIEIDSASDLSEELRKALQHTRKILDVKKEFYLNNKRITWKEYDSKFKEVMRSKGYYPTRKLDRGERENIKSILAGMGYVMQQVPRYTERGWQEVYKKLIIKQPDKYGEFKEKFKKHKAELEKLIFKRKTIVERTIPELKVKLTQKILKEKKIRYSTKHYPIIHMWKGYKVVTIFREGGRGIITRKILAQRKLDEF